MVRISCDCGCLPLHSVIIIVSPTPAEPLLRVWNVLEGDGLVGGDPGGSEAETSLHLYMYSLPEAPFAFLFPLFL